MSEDFELVRDAVRWHEYGSQDERRKKALPALDRIEAENDRLREDLLTLLRLLLVEDCAFVEGGAAQLENAAWPILDRMGGYEILERTSE